MMYSYKRIDGDYDGFIYTHIPKCGGTSFRALIYNSALQSGISESLLYIPGLGDLANDKNFDQLNEDEKLALADKKFKIIANHCKFDDHLHLNLQVKKPFYFTILRDPVKRFISHYNFFYKKLGYNNCKGVELNDLDKDKLEFLLKMLSNIQSKYISNVSHPKAVGEENIFKIAAYNVLYHYGFVGILEKQDEFLKQINKKLFLTGYILMEKMESLNTNRDKAKVNDEIIDKIKEWNKADILLYNFVQENPQF